VRASWYDQFSDSPDVLRSEQADRTVVSVPTPGLAIEIGGNHFITIAGPCSVETEAQLMATAIHVRRAGTQILRGGAFKPRSSPYSFQGLGLEGLRMLAHAREETGLAIVTEVILCERGIRTFETAMRNTFDAAGIAVLKQITHLPVIADPSHAAGYRELVPALARIGVAAGADGLIAEVHPNPDAAWSDGEQSLDFPGFDAMMQDLKPWLALRNQTQFCAAESEPAEAVR